MTRGSGMLRAAVAVAALGFAAAARADSIEALKAQVETLSKKVGELEQDNAARAARPAAGAAGAVTGGATPGSFRLPGSDTSVTLGGSTRSSVTAVPAWRAAPTRSTRRAPCRSAPRRTTSATS